MQFFKIRSLLLSFLFIVSLISALAHVQVLSLIASPQLWDSPVQAQTAPIPTVAYDVNGHRLTLPDWSMLTWANMPPMQESGEVQIPSDLSQELGYDPSRSWSAGEVLDSVVMLGDVEKAFNIGSLTLSALQQMQELVNLDDLTLDDFGILKTQTVATLVEAIPELSNIDISQVKPIQDLAASLGIPSGSGALSDILQTYPNLGESMLTDLDLKQYQLDSIFNLDQTPLNTFANWQQSFIKDIPALNQVPLATLAPKLSSLFDGLLALADNYFSNAEHGDPKVLDSMFVSGTVTCNGETVPVAVLPGQPSGYVELTDFTGLNGANYGQRWGSGDDQQVEGGCGPLASVNNGSEPTGRNAFGIDDFKLVLRNIDEKQEQADFWLYTHFCVDIPFYGKTCTPYFLPILPISSIEHNDAVLLGTGVL